jgi:hypothetical protein
MRFAREINRLLMGILVTFGIVSISAAYWSIVGPDTILRRDDNPRLVEAEASIMRGNIVDRHELGTSITNADGTFPAISTETSGAGLFQPALWRAARRPLMTGHCGRRPDEFDGFRRSRPAHRGWGRRAALPRLNVQQVFQALEGAALVVRVPDEACWR